MYDAGEAWVAVDQHILGFWGAVDGSIVPPVVKSFKVI